MSRTVETVVTELKTVEEEILIGASYMETDKDLDWYWNEGTRTLRDMRRNLEWELEDIHFVETRDQVREVRES